METYTAFLEYMVTPTWKQKMLRLEDRGPRLTVTAQWPRQPPPNASRSDC